MGEFWRLVGATLLGALISFGTTLYFERRKEQRTDKKEQQDQERELRQAARLVYEELDNTWIVLHRTMDTEVWWSNPPYDLESSAWAEHKGTLASQLDKDSWSAASTAYSGIAQFNMRLAISREGMEVPSLIPEEEEEEEAQRVLEPIQGKYPTQDWMLEVLYLYEWVDGAMELLARRFVNEQSQAKLRAGKRARAALRGSKNAEKS